MRVTLKEIAQLAGTSVSLASQVLNHKSISVTDEKKNAIFTAAKQLGYSAPKKKQSYKRSGRAGAPRLVVLIQPSLSFSYLAELTDRIGQHLCAAGFQMLVLVSDEDVEREKNNIEFLLKTGASGAIINASDNIRNRKAYKSIAERGIPLVFVDRYVLDVDGDMVMTNNEDATYLLTKKLIERGNEQIMFISHGKSLFTTVMFDRLAGYLRAMEEAKLPVFKEYIYADRPLASQPLCSALGDMKGMDAYVLATSWDFLPFIDILKSNKALRAKRYDFACIDPVLIPFDDVQGGMELVKSLHSVTQDAERMAQKAVQLIAQRIEESERGLDAENFPSNTVVEVLHAEKFIKK